jgi:hypothetical protein
MTGSVSEREWEVETVLRDVAKKNKASLDAAKIVPLAPDWQFCTNGLYLMLATAGCGKSRFIIKHILMADRMTQLGFGKEAERVLKKEPDAHYYSLIAFCSTSGEMDRTVQTIMDANVIKTPVVQVTDGGLMPFLARHLKRKKKYYAMIKYLQQKKINETLQHSVDKHGLKFWAYDAKKAKPPQIFDSVPYRGHPRSSESQENDVRQMLMVEKVNKPKLVAWILQKIESYGVSRSVCPLLVVLDDFAGHPLLERKETPLARMMTKCRHYSCTFIVAVQTAKYVIKNIRRQATDLVVWAGLSEEDFKQLFTEIQYSYDLKRLWEEYRKLPTQTSHLILNVKAQSYRFVVVEAR